MKEERGDQQGFSTPLKAILPGSLLPAPTNLALGSCLLAATMQKERKTCQLDGSSGALWPLCISDSYVSSAFTSHMLGTPAIDHILRKILLILWKNIPPEVLSVKGRICMPERDGPFQTPRLSGQKSRWSPN